MVTNLMGKDDGYVVIGQAAIIETTKAFEKRQKRQHNGHVIINIVVDICDARLTDVRTSI